MNKIAITKLNAKTIYLQELCDIKKIKLEKSPLAPLLFLSKHVVKARRFQTPLRWVFKQIIDQFRIMQKMLSL